MHRPTVGILTLVLLLAALLAPLVGGEQATNWQWACLRGAILMGAIWLALPRMTSVRPVWTLLGLLLAVVAVIVVLKRPFWALLAAMAALLLGGLSVGFRARGPR